jgi:hypothetical protein
MAEQSSPIYFPFWVYDQLNDGMEVTIENDKKSRNEIGKENYDCGFMVYTNKVVSMNITTIWSLYHSNSSS